MIEHKELMNRYILKFENMFTKEYILYIMILNILDKTTCIVKL